MAARLSPPTRSPPPRTPGADDHFPGEGQQSMDGGGDLGQGLGHLTADWSRAVIDGSHVRALKGGPKQDRSRSTVPEQAP
jgi:hypothetical protein